MLITEMNKNEKEYISVLKLGYKYSKEEALGQTKCTSFY